MAFSHAPGEIGELSRRLRRLRPPLEIERRLDRVRVVGLRALTLNELAEQPDRDELEGCHHKQHAEHEQRTVADRAEAEEPENAQIGEDRGSGQTEKGAGCAEHMQRASGKARIQHDAEEIEAALQQAVEAILRSAELPCVVVDRDLADPVAAPVQQNRNEAVKLAVERQALKRFGPVCLEAAIEIVEPDPAQPADHCIEDS